MWGKGRCARGKCDHKDVAQTKTAALACLRDQAWNGLTCRVGLCFWFLRKSEARDPQVGTLGLSPIGLDKDQADPTLSVPRGQITDGHKLRDMGVAQKWGSKLNPGK